MGVTWHVNERRERGVERTWTGRPILLAMCIHRRNHVLPNLRQNENIQCSPSRCSGSGSAPMAWNVKREHLHLSSHSHLTEPVHGRREIKGRSFELVQRARNCRVSAEYSTYGMPSTSRLLCSEHRNLAFLEPDRRTLMWISTAQVSVA